MVTERILHRIGPMAAAVFAGALMTTPGVAADTADEGWAALVKGGHVAMLRHGNASPGYGGDPPGILSGVRWAAASRRRS